MKTWNERLVHLMKDRGVIAYDLARAIGVSAPSVAQWMGTIEGKKPTQNISSKNAELLCSFLKTNREWLFHGSGFMGVTESLPGQTNGISIPQFVNKGGAMGNGLLLDGKSGQIISWCVDDEWVNKHIPHNTGKQNLCIVTGFGDSMRGMFNSGDPLIVDTGIKEVKYDGVYFFRIGDEGFIKRLQRIPGEGIRVISINQGYESWTIKIDMDFEVFGRVLKVWKSEEF